MREARARAAIALADTFEQDFLRAQAGLTAEVLFESRGGHTPNYCETELLTGAEGEVRSVRITGVRGGKLTVEPIF